jgi:response regulator RpfG family c-di-GMP phosphodiesterase
MPDIFATPSFCKPCAQLLKGSKKTPMINSNLKDMPMKDGATILAVDDTPESLALLAGILIPAGYHVLPADSGELALAAAAVNSPDLILLDVRMKGVDGLEVCRRLKAAAETKHIPIILISAFADVKEWVKGLQMGAADYISKPFQSEELISRVKTHLALRRASVSLQQKAADLQRVNEQLQNESAEHKRTEDKLRQSLDQAAHFRRALLSAAEDNKRSVEALREKNGDLQDALTQVKLLSGLLPICSGCKKIRDGKGYWSQVESYIQQHSEATFTHGLCPECIKKYYPEPKEGRSGDPTRETK